MLVWLNFVFEKAAWSSMLLHDSVVRMLWKTGRQFRKRVVSLEFPVAHEDDPL